MTQKQLTVFKRQLLKAFWWRPYLTLSEMSGVSGVGIDSILLPLRQLLIEQKIEVYSAYPMRYRRMSQKRGA